jgi:predicted adenylyl cyclase CyaB
MAIEIEIKAWADDWKSVKKHIDDFARYTGSYEKFDTYWIVPEEMKIFAPELKSGVRIRNESFTTLDEKTDSFTRVCFKKKELRTDMEVNIEKEFDITDVSVFEELLSDLGLIRGESKHKKGWSWKYEHITIELSEIEGLGWFCELEIIAEHNDSDLVAVSKNQLYETLKKIGIDTSKIESRYYTEMLKEKKAQKAWTIF